MAVFGSASDAVLAAQAYLTFDYPEAKDFAKSFLTLTSAVFVASISFAEKIIEFKSAKMLEKVLIISSWMMTFFSISLCGLAIVFIFRAGLSAKYGRHNYLETAYSANSILLVSGACFVVGLFALALAAVVSIFRTAGMKPEGELPTDTPV